MVFSRWKETIETLIENAVEQHPRGLAVFDFDNTLIYGDQGFNVMHYLLENRLIKARESWFWEREYWTGIPEETLHNLKTLYEKSFEEEHYYNDFIKEIYKFYKQLEDEDLEKAYRWTALLFAGFTGEELQGYARIAFEEALKKDTEAEVLFDGFFLQRGIRIYPVLRELIRRLLAREWEIYVVTASPAPVIQAVISYWNLQEHQVIGMELAEKNRILQPVILEPYPYGQGKYEALRRKTSRPVTIAVGDSFPDFSLLENARIPVFLYRKGKEEARRLAERKGFLIQEIS